MLLRFWELMTVTVVLATSVAATGDVIRPQDIITISNINARPDGFSRSVIAVNGQYPSPLIKARKGDEFELTVVNNLTDSTMLRQTSIHWHGIFQHRSAWADGPDGVTQCPISQFGNAFTYRFTAENDTGTYWYHSHFGTQYCDGLRGPLVIYDDNDPYKHEYNVDDENTIITLVDWYHNPAPSVPRGTAAMSQATLINGKGRQLGDTAGELAIVNVQQNETYRFRIISLSCDPDYTFSIDGHDLTIIEADGQLTDKLVVQELRIFAGQRYSVILHANQTIGNYWIRAIPNTGDTAPLPGRPVEDGVNSAILRYAKADIEDPTTQPHINPIVLEESNLHARINPMAPGGNGPPDVPAIVFNLSFQNRTFFMNPNETWVTPIDEVTNEEIPVLVQILNGVPPGSLLPANSIHSLPRNKVIEVTVPGFAIAGPHPFHLHGHAFSVVKSAGSTNFNYDNPVRRDVVSTGGSGDNVTIRFTTDNPGPWFFHCHIEFHLVAGLAAVFVEAQDAIPTNSPPPRSWFDLCPRFNSLPPNATAIEPLTTAV